MQLRKNKDSNVETGPKTENKSKLHFRVSYLPLGLNILFLILGVLMIVASSVTTLHICYILGFMVLAFGIVLIVRYFQTGAYRDLQRYGFSVGAMMVIIGIAVLVRATVVNEYFLFILGALMLLSAVFQLQNALDLKALKNPTWPLWLILSILFACLALAVILNPFQDRDSRESFTQVVILLDGIAALIGTLYLTYSVHKLNHEASSDADTAPSQDTGVVPADAENRAGERALAAQDHGRGRQMKMEGNHPEGEDRNKAGTPPFEDFDAGIDD